MNLKQSKKMYLSVLVVFLFIISSLNSISGIDIENDGEEISDSDFNSMVLKNNPVLKTITIENSFVNNNDLSILQDTEDHVISDESGDEYTPSMVIKGKNMVVAYEYSHNNETDIYLRRSNNYGFEWSDGYRLNAPDFSFDDVFSPDLSLIPNSYEAYVTYITSYSNSSRFGFGRIQNIASDSSDVDFSTVDWEEYGFRDFSNANILPYNNQTTPWVMSLIGTTNYSENGTGPANETLMFYFNSLDKPGDVVIAWYPDIQFCSNLSVANDYGESMIYGVSEIRNGSKKDLLFFKGKPSIWNDPNYEYLDNITFSKSESLMHPKIAVNGDNIFIVAETQTQGIILFKSSDAGENWTEIEIVDSMLNPSYPDIVIDDSQLICSYVSSYNLSYIVSNYTAANWTDSIKVNDINQTVEPGYDNTDMINTNHIAWTDNRKNNSDLYYNVGYIPRPDLKIVNFTLEKEMMILPTKNHMFVEVKNIGDGYATDIPIEISFERDDDKIIKISYVGEIAYLNADEKRTDGIYLFKFDFPEYLKAFVNFSGIENITATVDPLNTTGDSDMSNNALTKSVEYKDIFLIFHRFEWLFKIFR